MGTGVRTVALAMMVLGGAAALLARQSPEVAPDMSFFVTSVGRGFGANMGGLAGADAHCQQLAADAGRGQRMWRAYLSAPASAGRPATDARDRIGKGPWINAKGVQIASGVADLHSNGNGLDASTALTEKGTPVAPGRHDILTGSNPDGTLAASATDATCAGWTSHGAGRAMVGHHNRSGGGQRPASWNSAHISRGCSQRDLRASLGDGLIYCFAAD